jgi:SAM-dependent MidA family methyltransferase
MQHQQPHRYSTSRRNAVLDAITAVVVGAAFGILLALHVLGVL